MTMATGVCGRCLVGVDMTPRLHGGMRTVFWVLLIVGVPSLGLGWVAALIVYLTGRSVRCGACQSPEVVTLDSPRGRELMLRRAATEGK